MSKIIHQIYDKAPTGLYRKWSDSVRSNLPGWDYILWDDKSIMEFLLKYHPTMIDLYQSYIYDIQRWDAIRYMIIYSMGGVYVDMDVEFYMNSDHLLQGPCTLFNEYMDFDKYNEYYDYFPATCPLITNSIFYADKNNPFIKSIIRNLKHEQINQVKYNHPGTKVMMSTGPGVLSKYYYRLNRVYNIVKRSNIYFESVSKSQRKDILNGSLSLEVRPHGMHWNIGSWIISEKSQFKTDIDYE